MHKYNFWESDGSYGGRVEWNHDTVTAGMVDFLVDTVISEGGQVESDGRMVSESELRALVPASGMSLEAIKAAVSDGKRVCWKSEAYEVISDTLGQWLIRCTMNNSCIGLTWADGVTMNGKEADFFIA